MKLSAAIRRASALARKVRAYYDAELPKFYPEYPLVYPGEVGPPPPKEEEELRSFLQSLPPETIYRLFLVMLLGREDFKADDLPGEYEALKRKLGKPERAVLHLMATVPLADQLSDGLAELKLHRIPVDALPVADAETAKA